MGCDQYLGIAEQDCGSRCRDFMATMVKLVWFAIADDTCELCDGAFGNDCSGAIGDLCFRKERVS